MGISFRPLTVKAADALPYANRFGSEVLQKGLRQAKRHVDGYLLIAKRSDETTVTVYAYESPPIIIAPRQFSGLSNKFVSCFGTLIPDLRSKFDPNDTTPVFVPAGNDDYVVNTKRKGLYLGVPGDTFSFISKSRCQQNATPNRGSLTMCAWASTGNFFIPPIDPYDPPGYNTVTNASVLVVTRINAGSDFQTLTEYFDTPTGGVVTGTATAVTVNQTPHDGGPIGFYAFGISALGIDPDRAGAIGAMCIEYDNASGVVIVPLLYKDSIADTAQRVCWYVVDTDPDTGAKSLRITKSTDVIVGIPMESMAEQRAAMLPFSLPTIPGTFSPGWRPVNDSDSVFGFFGSQINIPNPRPAVPRRLIVARSVFDLPVVGAYAAGKLGIVVHGMNGLKNWTELLCKCTVNNGNNTSRVEIAWQPTWGDPAGSPSVHFESVIHEDGTITHRELSGFNNGKWSSLTYVMGETGHVLVAVYQPPTPSAADEFYYQMLLPNGTVVQPDVGGWQSAAEGFLAHWSNDDWEYGGRASQTVVSHVVQCGPDMTAMLYVEPSRPAAANFKIALVKTSTGALLYASPPSPVRALNDYDMNSPAERRSFSSYLDIGMTCCEYAVLDDAGQIATMPEFILSNYSTDAYDRGIFWCTPDWVLFKKLLGGGDPVQYFLGSHAAPAVIGASKGFTTPALKP